MEKQELKNEIERDIESENDDADSKRDMSGSKSYIGSKILRAKRMDHYRFLEQYRDTIPTPDQDNEEGYVVFYPDGYTSWSPKHTFETAYREVTTGEKALMGNE